MFFFQRCDPAPFYLFDEIDAALDPQYRTTVAAMLRKQAHDARAPAQFIITTFHPQVCVPACCLFRGVRELRPFLVAFLVSLSTVTNVFRPSGHHQR